MGKAAQQRRVKRLKFRAKLAHQDPNRFQIEWEKRLSSWLELIARDAGRLKTKDGHPVASIFGYPEGALMVLRNCGQDAFKRLGEESYDLLLNECCRQIALKVDSRLYRLNSYPIIPTEIPFTENSQENK
jgi:hypothetical protein